MQFLSFGMVRWACVMLALAVASFPSAAIAQEYPARPITLIVTFPPGGGTDTVARRVAERLSVRLGQPIVVDNKAGAGGTIGASIAARAPADGYTLMFATTSVMAVSPALRAGIGYDPLTSFASIGLMAQDPFVLFVRSPLPVQTVDDLIRFARANPDKLNFGSPGLGSAHHLVAELLMQVTGIRMVHVPYRGGAPAWTALAGGEIDVLFDTMPQPLSFVRSGKARALAVAAPERLALLPGVPTLAAAGIRGADTTFWWGLVAPAGTPKRIIELLAAELKSVLRESDVVETFDKLGIDVFSSSPQEFDRLIRSEVPRWRQVIQSAGVKIDQ